MYLAQIQGTDLAAAMLGDAYSYDAWARRIASGEWLGDKVFYQAPLYPYFLGVLYALAGHSLLAVRVAQCVVGSSSCLFMGKAGEQFFSKRAGLLTGVLMALCPTLIFFDCLVQKAVLDVFFFALVLLLAAVAKNKGANRRWWLFLGIAAGLLALTRENALVVMPLLLLWAWQHGRLRAVLTLVAGTVCVLFPVAARNRLIGGEFHLTTSQAGPNFYIGNNERADGSYQPLLPLRGDPLFERTDAVEIAERELGRPLSPGEVSDFWVAKSFKFIRSAPWQWLKLMGRKWFLVWNAAELADTEEQCAYAVHSPLLRWLSTCLHFGVLCPLAAGGVVLTWPRRREIWLLMAIALVYAASVSLFYVLARYRLPLYPIVIAFAAAGVIRWSDRARSPFCASSWAAILAMILTATFVNWPIASRSVDGLVTWQNLGTWFAKLGQDARAVEYFDKVLECVPESVEAHAGKGVALGKLGCYDESIPHLEAALRLAPDLPEARMNLGIAILSKGNAEESLAHFQQALSLAPKSAKVYYNLGNAMLQLGRMPEAAANYGKAVELDPDMAEARNNLGLLLFQMGQTDEALKHFRRSVELRPQVAGARVNLGVALRKSGRVREAVQAYEEALVLDPNQAVALSNLSWILATCSDAAIRNGARALDLATRADALSQHRRPGALRSLAAALAENGRFADAQRSVESAIKLLEAQGDSRFAEILQKERNSYRAGQPFREDP